MTDLGFDLIGPFVSFSHILFLKFACSPNPFASFVPLQKLIANSPFVAQHDDINSTPYFLSSFLSCSLDYFSNNNKKKDQKPQVCTRVEWE